MKPRIPSTDIKTAQLPTYREIMGQMLEQLNQRKGTLFLRVLLILAPALVGMGLLMLLGSISKVADNSFTNSAAVWVIMILGILLLMISPWWMLVIGHIFKIERIIWIDAFFDKITLSGSQSWRMARKLFWPSAGLDIIIFIRYYLLIYIAILGGISGYFALLVKHSLTFQVLPFLLSLAIIGVTLWLYGMYVRIKLRYIWFLFIDFQGTDRFSYGFLFSELKRLNKVYGNEAFKKLAVTSFGTDVAGEAVNALIGEASRGLAASGDAGKAAGFFVDTIAGESVGIAKDYAKMTAFYMYYQIARSVLYNQAQAVNSPLYSNDLPSSSSKQ